MKIEKNMKNNDEMNGKIHKTLVLTMDYDTALTRESFATSENMKKL